MLFVSAGVIADTARIKECGQFLPQPMLKFPMKVICALDAVFLNSGSLLDYVHCTCSKEQDPNLLGLPGLWKPIELACEGAVPYSGRTFLLFLRAMCSLN